MPDEKKAHHKRSLSEATEQKMRRLEALAGIERIEVVNCGRRGRREDCRLPPRHRQRGRNTDACGVRFAGGWLGMSSYQYIDCERVVQGSDEAFAVVNLSTVYERFEDWRKKMPRVHVSSGIELILEAKLVFIQPFYAIKSNSDPMIAKLLADLGAGFDCASLQELEDVGFLLLISSLHNIQVTISDRRRRPHRPRDDNLREHNQTAFVHQCCRQTRHPQDDV